MFQKAFIDEGDTAMEKEVRAGDIAAQEQRDA